MTPEDTLRRAEAAARLLRDEVATSAFTAVSADLSAKILALPLDKRDEREAMVAEYQGIVRVLKKLRQWEGEGALARADIERASRS